MNIKILSIVTTGGLFILLFGCATMDRSGQFYEQTMKLIANDVASGKVQRVTVFSVASEVRTFLALRPSGLEQMSTYTVTTNLEGTLGSEFVASLKATTARVAAVQPDLRWGAHLMDSNNVCIHKLYVDARGTGAIIDGTPARVSRHLVRWFKKSFSRRSTPEHSWGP